MDLTNQQIQYLSFRINMYEQINHNLERYANTLTVFDEYLKIQIEKDLMDSLSLKTSEHIGTRYLRDELLIQVGSLNWLIRTLKSAKRSTRSNLILLPSKKQFYSI